MTRLVPRFPAICFVLLSLTGAPGVSANALCQDVESDPSKARGKVIGRVWHTAVNGGQMIQYTQRLSKELGMQQSPVMMFAGGMGSGMSMLGGQADVDFKGTLVFLETFPKTGTPHLIGFQKVGGLSEFQKLVKQRAKRMGPMGELIGEGDRFESKLNLQNLPVPNQDTNEGDGETRSFRIEVRSEIVVGDKPPEDDTQRTPDSLSTYYRYQDGIMYSGQQEAIHFLDLPTSESMMPDEDVAKQDIHGVFDLTQIPKHLKQALWASLQAQTRTYMQRFDNEATGDYSLRHTLGQGRLELLKAAMFDVDNAEFSLKLADTDDAAIAFDMKLDARKNSPLAATLKQLNQTPSRLGILRDEETPFVISTTFDLPEWSQPLAAEFIESLKVKLQEATNDESMDQVIGDLFRPVLAAAGNGNLDAAIRMEGDFDSGMVLAGGVRLPDATEFQTTLETLLLLKSGNGTTVGRNRIGELDIIQVNIDSIAVPGTETPIPVQIHMVGKGNYLWFAAGGQNAADILAEHIENEERVLDAQVRSMPLLVRMRLSQWMADSPEQTANIPSQILVHLEKAVARIFSPMFNMQVRINGSDVAPNTEPEFTSYAGQVLKGRSGDLEIGLQTSGRSISLSAEIGTGVAKFVAAQYAAAQNRLFSNLKFDFATDGSSSGTIRSIRIGN